MRLSPTCFSFGTAIAILAVPVPLPLVYKPEMFIFLDETGHNRRNTLRQYAYSWRGKPAKLLVRGTHLNAIGFMSAQDHTGLQDCTWNCGWGVHLLVYWKGILPCVLAFDGVNPHSVVIMDNAFIHHVDGTVEMIQDAGALLLFLPPYSPDFQR